MRPGFEKRLIYLSPKELLPPDLFEDGRDRYRILLLSESLREYGLFLPVTIRRQGSGYTLIDGALRVRAAALAGIGKIPCLVCTSGDPLLMKTVLQLAAGQKDLFETVSSLPALMNRYSPEAAACALSLSTKELLCLSCFDLFDEGVKQKARKLCNPLFLAGRLYEIDKANRSLFLDKIETLYNRQPLPDAPPAPRPHPPAVKDPRFYINSIRKIADRMTDNGLNATVKQRETANYTEITLRISKKSVDQPQLSLLG